MSIYNYSWYIKNGIICLTYNVFLDTVLSYIVNCQVLYLFSVSISIPGLVLLAGEHYLLPFVNHSNIFTTRIPGLYLPLLFFVFTCLHLKYL